MFYNAFRDLQAAEVAPDTNAGKYIMFEKKKIVLFIAALLSFAVIQAQRKVVYQEDIKTFEEAMTRTVEPEVKVYIRPKVADLSMIATARQYYGPYKYNVKSLNEDIFENLKKSALYRDTKESDADVMVATIFDSYTLDGDDNTLIIEISGFPAKYVNFRDFGGVPEDVDMVKWVYPAAYSPTTRQQEEDRNTRAADRGL